MLRLQRVNASSCQLIALAYHGVELHALVEQQSGGGTPPILVPTAIANRASRFQTNLGQRFQRALGAVGGGRIRFIAANNGDTVASARNQMIHGHAPGVHIVTRHRTIVGVGGRTIHIHQRHAPITPQRRARIRLALHNQQAVHFQRQQFLYMASFQRIVTASIGE